MSKMRTIDPAREAWGHVADGFAAGLWTEGIGERDLQLLSRGYEAALRAAGRPLPEHDDPEDK